MIFYFTIQSLLVFDALQHSNLIEYFEYVCFIFFFLFFINAASEYTKEKRKSKNSYIIKLNSALVIVALGFTNPNQTAYSQAFCNNPLGNISLNTSWQYFYHTCLGYVTFQANAGCTYEFTYCNSVAPSSYYSADPYLTVSTQPTSGGLTQNDDWCGLGSRLTWTATTSGTYYLNLGNCCSSQCGCGQNRNLGYRSTNCVSTVNNPTSIAASVNPLCSGNSTNLVANGAQGTVHWYTGGCGVTPIGTGNPLLVSPTTTTTYWARNFNGGQFSSGCATVNITVNPSLPTAGPVSGPNVIIAGSTYTYSIPPVPGASYLWSYTQSLTGVLWVNIPGSNSPSITHTWPQTTTDGAIRVKVISPFNCNEQTIVYPIITDGALPVELLYFKGTEFLGSNYLEWATATEHNSSHFIVEKSEDGYVWKEIGQQWAAINSTQEIHYDLIDNNVYPIINYYRLKQFDIDGENKKYGPIAINNIKDIKPIDRYINILGQIINPDSPGMIIIVYQDGTTERIIKY